MDKTNNNVLVQSIECSLHLIYKNLYEKSVWFLSQQNLLYVQGLLEGSMRFFILIREH